MNFEDIRLHLAARHQLKKNEPYVLSFDVALGQGRAQSLFLVDLETEEGPRVLRVSTPVAPLTKLPAVKCLRFNWHQRLGYLAVDDLDGEPYVHLCENRSYSVLGMRELDHIVRELASWADRLESLVTGGDRT